MSTLENIPSGMSYMFIHEWWSKSKGTHNTKIFDRFFPDTPPYGLEVKNHKIFDRYVFTIDNLIEHNNLMQYVHHSLFTEKYCLRLIHRATPSLQKWHSLGKQSKIPSALCTRNFLFCDHAFL